MRDRTASRPLKGFGLPAIVGVVLGTALLSAAAQTGTIVGRVVDGRTRQGINGAEVSLGVQGTPNVFTDSRGRFAFQNVPPLPALLVSASKLGYLDGWSGVPSGVLGVEFSVPTVFAEGQVLRDLEITLWRPSTIEGRVLDDAGRPLAGAIVRADARLDGPSGPIVAAGPSDRTDDRGVYRLTGLAGGVYAVAVMPRDIPAPPRDGMSRLYPVTYYPGSGAIDAAEWVRVSRSDVRHAVDVIVGPVIGGSVRGVVAGEGEPSAMAGLTARLSPTGATIPGTADVLSVPVDRNGAFEFIDVPPGSYDVRVAAEPTTSTLAPVGGRGLPSPASSQMSPRAGAVLRTSFGQAMAFYPEASGAKVWGAASVRVLPAQAATVAVRLERAFRLSGRIVGLNGIRLPPARLLVTAEPGGGAAVIDRETGQFSIEGLVPGSYALRLPNARRLAVDAVRWRGVDYRDGLIAVDGDVEGVEIQVTGQGSRITGAVVTSSGQRAAGATVVVFPAREDHRSVSETRCVTTVDNAGHFDLQECATKLLPAGDYLAIAVDAASSRRWLERAFLDRVAPQSTPVTLGAGETRQVELTLQERLP